MNEIDKKPAFFIADTMCALRGRWQRKVTFTTEGDRD